ncbi:MAG: VOC family protein [Thermomicrobiales bacterium]
MPTTTFSHIALACKDPRTVERFYAKHFGFRRTRVYPAESIPGLGEVIIISSAGLSLELFPAKEERPVPAAGGDGPWYPGFRHLAFLVDNLDASLAQMGDEANITFGPIDLGFLVPGMRVAWLADPEGNIVELNQGYVDEANPPQD